MLSVENKRHRTRGNVLYEFACGTDAVVGNGTNIITSYTHTFENRFTLLYFATNNTFWGLFPGVGETIVKEKSGSAMGCRVYRHGKSARMEVS